MGRRAPAAGPCDAHTGAPWRALAYLWLSGLCTVAARWLCARADRALGPPRRVAPPPRRGLEVVADLPLVGNPADVTRAIQLRSALLPRRGPGAKELRQ